MLALKMSQFFFVIKLINFFFLVTVHDGAFRKSDYKAFYLGNLLKSRHSQLSMDLKVKTESFPSIKDGKILVTGVFKESMANDKHLLNILNKQGVWSSIALLASDTSVAKKKLLSRESRYSGLLDVLSYVDGDAVDCDRIKGELKGFDAFLYFDCAPLNIPLMVDAAITAKLQRLVITSTFDVDDADSMSIVQAATQKLKDASIGYTIIRTDGIIDSEEGKSYQLRNITDKISQTGYDFRIAKGDIMRLAAEALVTPSTQQTTFAALGGSSLSMEYLRQLREKGMDRRQELDHIIATGEYPKFERKEYISKRVETEGEFWYTPEMKAKDEMKRKSKDLASFQEYWKSTKEDYYFNVMRILHEMCEFYWWKSKEAGTVKVNRAVFRQTYAPVFSPFAQAVQRRYDCGFRIHQLFLTFEVKSRAEFEKKYGVTMEWDDEEYDEKLKNMTDKEAMKEVEIHMFIQNQENGWKKLVDFSVFTDEVLREFDETGQVPNLPINWLM